MVRLQDILENVRLIQSYLLGMDRPAFEADRRGAAESCLERVSAAASEALTIRIAQGPSGLPGKQHAIVDDAQDLYDPIRCFPVDE